MVKEFGNKQARRKNIILTVFYPIHVYKYTTNLALALKWGKALVSFFCASGPRAPRGDEISTIRPSCRSASRNLRRGMMSTPGSSRTTFRRQNHITFIFIKTMSYDLVVQMAYSADFGKFRLHFFCTVL